MKLDDALLKQLTALVDTISATECEGLLPLAATLVKRLNARISFANSPFNILSDLSLITDHVGESDAYAAALACSSFRRALTERRSASGAAQWRSAVADNLGSVTRVTWAVQSGMPLVSGHPLQRTNKKKMKQFGFLVGLRARFILLAYCLSSDFRKQYLVHIIAT